MAIALTPRWKAQPFSISPGFPLFDPVISDENALMVAGGPEALAVFSINTQHHESLTIPKKSWITGFVVSGDSLYVQDGPVLINYNLTQLAPLAALNLVTGARWTFRDKESTEPPDSIYLLTDDDAVLQRQLIAARRAHASALLSAQSPGVHATALRTAQHNARRIDFSPPVVRKHQLEAQRSAQIFSLCMDGRVYAIDTALEEALTLGFEVPLRPELVLAEIRKPEGIECRLYYVTESGGIQALDATGDLALLPGWAGTGAPVPEAVLPLRLLDGMLLGGGILGDAFFARTLNPAVTLPFFRMDGPPGGWRQYDIDPREKILLISDGRTSSLVSYDPAAKSRIRWKGDRVSERDVHVMFLEGKEHGELKPLPKLTLEIEKTRGDEPGINVRALLANTVDSTDPVVLKSFPPPAILLDQGKFESGPNRDWLPSIDSLPCRPAVMQNNIYAVVGAKAASGVWAYSVVAFWLAPQLLSELLAKADTGLARLRQLARVLELNVVRVDRWTEIINMGMGDVWPRFRPEPIRIPRSEGPYPVVNERLTFELTPGGRLEVTTNAKGIARFDSEHAGAKVTVATSHGDCTPVALTPADTKTIGIHRQTEDRER